MFKHIIAYPCINLNFRKLNGWMYCNLKWHLNNLLLFSGQHTHTINKIFSSHWYKVILKFVIPHVKQRVPQEILPADKLQPLTWRDWIRSNISQRVFIDCLLNSFESSNLLSSYRVSIMQKKAQCEVEPFV